MSYGRIYVVRWDAATAVSVAADLFELVPADDKPICIHELKVWQTSDLGDAAEEIIGISIVRGNATSGSGGGTPTIVPAMGGAAAAAFTGECRNTTAASTGSPVFVGGDGWNVRVPYIWTPAPEDRVWCTQAQTLLCVRLDAAPADALTMNASMIVEEIG